MKNQIKCFLQNIIIYWSSRSLLNKCKQRKVIMDWEKGGKSVPPPHIIKQNMLREYAERYKLKTLVETGTFYGDMVNAMKGIFKKVYSIELDYNLSKQAKKRFKAAKNVEIIHGDSGVELVNILNKVNEPVLFWLDGHYSGGITAKGELDTPILQELHCILNSKERQHVIIIDDARLFGTDQAYPTLDEIKKFVFSIRTDMSITVRDDSIRVVPEL